jgi:hypothetical protein
LQKRARADDIRAKLRALRVERAASAATTSVTAITTAAKASAGRRLPSPADTEPLRTPPPAASENQAGQELGRYIKGIVHEQFYPLMGECYEELLRRHPGLAGKLILDVNVIADPSLGGVIDSAKVAKGSTLDDGEFTTCVEESMKSLSFDAPPDGRDFDFTYPFELAP